MKTHQSRRQRLLACLSLLTPALVFAQTTAPQPSPAAKPADELLILSPFVVDATADEGYRSSVTTSGSRLKTDLKDVAASITVLTDDFMNDLGANDVASALAFVSGAENDSTTHNESQTFSGNNNYIGGDFGDANNRSAEVRIRGLGKATNTINYIEVLGSTDRYNTDRTEFLRGANSILFGLAEPAGLINSSTKVASTRKNSTKIETKFDDQGSNRFILDHNQVLIKNKLALRTIGLLNDQQYAIKTAYQKDRRLFLTGTYTPFSGTTIRGYVESQKTHGRRPNNRTVQDNVSDWLAAYNKYAPQMTPAQIAAAFYWDPSIRTANSGAAPTSLITLADGSTVDLGAIRRDLDTTNAGTALLYSPGQWTDPLDNRAVALAYRNVTSGALLNPGGRFIRSGSPRENLVGFLDPQVTNAGIFPYESVEIGALPGNYRTERDRKVYLYLDQRITPDFYVSAAFQHEARTTDQYFATITQTNQISLDINSKLPDGRTNPNFLRPFIYGRNLGEYINHTLDSVVLQANYDFDFAKKTKNLGWLGRHRVTGVHTRAEQDRLRYQYNYQYDSDTPTMPQSIAGTSNARFNMQIWYVGDPVKVGDTALNYTGFPTNMGAQKDRSYNYQYFNTTTNAWEIAPDKISTSRHLVTNGRTFTINKNFGTGLSWQSFYWNDKIVTLFGLRRDKVDNVQRSLPTTLVVPPFPTLLGKSRSDYLPTGSRYTFEDDTSTQSIVYKPLKWLRVFANRSENFAASSQRQDNLYRPVPPQAGDTQEFGFGVTLFDDKLDVKVTHFASAQKNAGSGAFGQVPNNRIIGFENRLYNALSNAGRLAEWSTIGEFGATITGPYATPNGTTATESRESTGTSLELDYSPTRNWEIKLSVDKIENKITAVGSELADFFAVRAPFYKKYFTEGLATNGTTKAADDFAANVAAEYTAGAAFVGTSNRGIADYVVTSVARYKFLDGRLKGLTVGAALRWESGKIIGYKLVDAIYNFGGLENYLGKTYDINAPYMGGATLAGGMQASYKRKIWSGRVMWRVQLNAQNLFSETGLRKIGANADGTPVWGVLPYRAYELTNSFEF